MSGNIEVLRFDGHVDNYAEWRAWITAQYAWDLQDNGTLNEDGKMKLAQLILRSVTKVAAKFVTENIKDLKNDPLKFLTDKMDQQFGTDTSDDAIMARCDRIRAKNQQDSLRVIDEIIFSSNQISSLEAMKKAWTIIALDRIHPIIRDRIMPQVTSYDIKTIRKLVVAALGDEERKQFRTAEATAEINRVAKDGASKPRRKLEDIECYYCGRRGHLVKHCKKRKREQSGKTVMKVQGGKESLLIVDLDIGGSVRKCFLDGGASVSLVRPEKLREMDVVALREEETTLRAANGSKMKASAVAQVEMRFGNRTFLVELLVTDDLPLSNYDVLIGLDTLQKGRICVNYGNGTVYVNAITQELDEDFRRVVEQYEDVLVERLDKDVGKARVPEMVIKVDSSKPPSYRRNYRMTPEEREALEKEVAKMLETGVIEPTGEDALRKGWNSPVLLVRKKSGDFRFCVDFRKLNEVTYKINRPLPRIVELVEGATKASYFSKLDLASGYWQIPVAKESRPYLAFEANRQQYQFTVMPFGITNAPAVFQTMIERVLGDIPGVSAYIDDVVVYSESKQEHLKTLEEVLKRMRAFNLKANVNKCEFGKREIEVFGFLVANGTVRPSPSRVEALSKMKKPTNPKELQSFLGMLNYYRDFIPDFATSEAFLRGCIKNWRWTTACDVAYDRLMDLLAKLATLHPNCGDAPLELHTDASQVAIAGVLMQVKNGQRLPIGYYSRMLKDAEQRYSTTEKELLAVHNSVLHFRPYLGYKRFTVHTDHKPLLGILRSSKTPFGPRWSKRLLQLAEFQYDVHYIRGEDNAVPDAISRAVNAIKVSWQSLAEAQQFDSEVQRLLETDPTVKIVDGEVYKTWPDGRKRLVLPQAFRLEALKDAHSTAHLGYKKTQHRLLNAFWWPGAGKDVAKFVGSCSTCLKKPYKRNVVERAEHLEIGATWETLALDHTGPFVAADGSKKWIVVLIDMFTKYVEAKVVPNAGADEVVKFVKSAFYRHGCPKSILADNAKTFVSKSSCPKSTCPKMLKVP